VCLLKLLFLQFVVRTLSAVKDDLPGAGAVRSARTRPQSTPLFTSVVLSFLRAGRKEEQSERQHQEGRHASELRNSLRVRHASPSMTESTGPSAFLPGCRRRGNPIQNASDGDEGDRADHGRSFWEAGLRPAAAEAVGAAADTEGPPPAGVCARG